MDSFVPKKEALDANFTRAGLRKSLHYRYASQKGCGIEPLPR
jgi:hypothetical protein